VCCVWSVWLTQLPLGLGDSPPTFELGNPQLLSWGPLTYWSSNFQQLRIAKQCRTLAHVVLLCSLLEHIYYDIKRPQNGGCGYRPDVDLDLGLGQGHISMHTTYRTTSIRDHVTLASSNTEIWPFESPVISTFRKVWSRDSLLLLLPLHLFNGLFSRTTWVSWHQKGKPF